jgi:hypothetical protein
VVYILAGFSESGADSSNKTLMLVSIESAQF